MEDRSKRGDAKSERSSGTAAVRRKVRRLAETHPFPSITDPKQPTRKIPPQECLNSVRVHNEDRVSVLCGLPGELRYWPANGEDVQYWFKLYLLHEEHFVAVSCMLGCGLYRDLRQDAGARAGPRNPNLVVSWECPQPLARDPKKTREPLVRVHECCHKYACTRTSR